MKKRKRRPLWEMVGRLAKFIEIWPAPADECCFSGVTIIHHIPGRTVARYPGNVAVKLGKGIQLGEAAALTAAQKAGVPVPGVVGTEIIQGVNHLKMDFIQGEALSKLWPKMSSEEKRDIAQQLREVLTIMRSATPPPNYIGACDNTGIREARVYHLHTDSPCVDEAAFNRYLLSGLFPATPPALRDAFASKLRTNHRVVLSHCDLAPRNIIVREGKIVALVDWEDAGWYPEYWEYVKFFQRNSAGNGDWWSYAYEIFPELYPDELVEYIALLKWQMP
jgi:tRNA A-37 threonylcarbamoyl transferase component Bud32